MKKTLLVVLAVVGGIAVSAIDFRRSCDFEPVTLGARRSNVPAMLYFAEAQLKYGMFQNYLHYWIDRPLFWNRATRHPENQFEYTTYPSFLIDMAQMSKYGFNGLGAFGMPRGKFLSLVQWDRYLTQAKLRNVQVLPQINYGESAIRRDTTPDEIVCMLKYCLNSPNMPRVNGKLLVGTYNYRLLTASRHQKMMAELHQLLGRDDFMIIGDVNMRKLRRLQRRFRAHGALTTAEWQELETMLVEVLDVADGVQLIISELVRPSSGEYTSSYDTTFFEQCTAKVLKKLLALPKYRNKVLGFLVNQGYINHLSGMNHGEYGTFTLRNIMRQVLKFNPDYLLFFEWNEANENTQFQPTIYSGRTIGRLFHYYTNLSRHQKITPFDNDDPAIPTLTLSHRATCKLGEKVHFELLNIPNGTAKKIYVAQLQLLDTAGHPAVVFPVEKIDSTRLGAIDYTVPSEQFQAGQVLRPMLTVNGREFRNFQTLRIDPSMSINYKAVRQSLADLLPIDNLDFSVRQVKGNTYSCQVNLQSREPLASVELLCNEDEVDACDSQKEFDREKNVILGLELSAPPSKSARTTGRIWLKNVSDFKISPCFRANVDTGVLKKLKNVPGVRSNFFIWSQQLIYYVQVPRQDVNNAELIIELKDRKFQPCRFRLRQVAEDGIAAGVLCEQTGLRAELRRVTELPDLPYQLNRRTASWRSQVEVNVPFPVFTIRAISRSGKIFRSQAIQPRKIPAQPLVQLPIFSETAKKRQVVQVPRALLPDIEYEFRPDAGAMLLNPVNEWFHGHLGGGFHYMEAFSSRLTPVKSGNRAPQWIKEDNRWLLRFDGVNDYINFTRETFPQGAFTLTMELRPDYNATTMVLFRHFNYYLGSISLFIRDGKLYGNWGEKSLKNYSFPTGLQVDNRKWNRIEVSYDLKNLTFKVNGKVKSFPFSGRAYAFKSAIFGGHTKPEYAPIEKMVFFKGDLKRLAIRHFR